MRARRGEGLNNKGEVRDGDVFRLGGSGVLAGGAPPHPSAMVSCYVVWVRSFQTFRRRKKRVEEQ